MNRLLAFCLCTAFVSVACGDDPFVVVPGKSATTSSEKDDNTAGGTDAADEQEWKPRLRVFLHTPTDTQVVQVRTVRVPVARDPFGGNDSQSGQTYLDRKILVMDQLVEDVQSHAGLYCDALSIDITEGADGPGYHLQCEGRLLLRFNGLEFAADSAVFKDDKCELVNATLTHLSTTAKSEKLTLTLPIHGVVTTTFGKSIEEQQPKRTPLQPTPDPLSTPFTRS